MIRIDLPRVEVNARRLLLFAIQLADTGRSVTVRQQPQIPSTADGGHMPVTQPDGSDGNLRDRPRGRVQNVRMPLKPGDAIPVVRDGVDARIMREAALNQRFERPER